ncbi:MAG TPA: hypothetical protein VNK45_05560 [Candidatus Acidoferrales bacterium]|nr:hypothetical protein [Candidatus Acidoferrales bacterium]
MVDEANGIASFQIRADAGQIQFMSSVASNRCDLVAHHFDAGLTSTLNADTHENPKDTLICSHIYSHPKGFSIDL